MNSSTQRQVASVEQLSETITSKSLKSWRRIDSRQRPIVSAPFRTGTPKLTRGVPVLIECLRDQSRLGTAPGAAGMARDLP